MNGHGGQRGYDGPPRGHGGFHGGWRHGHGHWRGGPPGPPPHGFYGGFGGRRHWHGGRHMHGGYRSGCLGCITYIAGVLVLAAAVFALVLICYV